MESTVTEAVDEYQTVFSSAVSTVTNGTIVGPNRRLEILTTISKTSSTTSLVIIMIMMGCTIDLNDVKESFRRPVGFTIGMVSQFVLMPLISFCLALALQLETAGALALLILGCCPGGTLSNIFTYWTDGDVSLSVSMTTVSSAAAIGMMPLNLFIYSRMWTDEGAVIPYTDIVITLVSIVIPVLFGVALRYYRENWVVYVRKISSVAIILLIIVSFIIIFLINPTFYKAAWGLWVSAIILPVVGYAIGFGFAFLLRQSSAKCRAIAFETGSQNVVLASTLTSMSFAGTDLFFDMLLFPTLYAIFIFVDSALVVVIYRLFVRGHGDGELSSGGVDIGPLGERGVTDVDKVINADGDEKRRNAGGNNHHGNGIDKVHGVYIKDVELEEMDERNGGMVTTSSHGENGNAHVNGSLGLDNQDNNHVERN